MRVALTFVLAVVLAAAPGCISQLGKTTAGVPATETEAERPAETLGLTIGIGQVSAGAVKGGAVSVPGAALLDGVVCGLVSLAAAWLRAPQPSCAGDQVEDDGPGSSFDD